MLLEVVEKYQQFPEPVLLMLVLTPTPAIGEITLIRVEDQQVQSGCAINRGRWLPLLHKMAQVVEVVEDKMMEWVQEVPESF